MKLVSCNSGFPSYIILECIGYVADVDLVGFLVIDAPRPVFYQETQWCERPLWEGGGRRQAQFGREKITSSPWGANLANWAERDPNPQSGISHRFEADVHGFYQTDLSPVKSAQSLGRGSH